MLQLFLWAIEGIGKTVTFFTETIKNPDFLSNVLGAFIASIVAAFIGIWYSRKERNDSALGKTKIVRGDESNSEQSVNGIYVQNNSDITIRNFYVKYKSGNKIKKKRIKVLFPDDFEEIEPSYENSVSQVNAVMRKSKMQFILRSNRLCIQIDKIFSLIAKIFNWLWKGILFFPVHFRILNLFFKINTSFKRVSRIDDDFLLYCFLNEKIANAENDLRTVNYDLKFSLYRSNLRSKMPAFLTATLLRNLRKNDNVSELYNKYLLTTLDFFIYYFMVHKNMDIQFYQTSTNFAGGRSDSFHVKYKDYNNPDNSYTPESQFSIFLTYCLFSLGFNKEKIQYESFERWLEKWAQLSKEPHTDLVADKIKANYESKKEYGLILINQGNNEMIINLKNGKNIKFDVIRGLKKFITSAISGHSEESLGFKILTLKKVKQRLVCKIQYTLN